jgi:hypothetical protein
MSQTLALQMLRVHDARMQQHHRHGGAWGIAIGAALGVIVVVLIHSQISGGLRYKYWLPAGLAMGVVGGGVVGLLFAEVWMGGREDEAATRAAEKANTQSGEGTAP